VSSLTKLGLTPGLEGAPMPCPDLSTWLSPHLVPPHVTDLPTRSDLASCGPTTQLLDPNFPPSSSNSELTHHRSPSNSKTRAASNAPKSGAPQT
jgi:hypothetical protein